MFNKGSCGLWQPLPFFPLSRFIYQCRHRHWLAKILFKIQINRHLLITIFFSSRQLLAPFSTVSLGKPPAPICVSYYFYIRPKLVPYFPFAEHLGIG